ncbi:ribonuclease H-like domain-containing protein [Tanacetum coccineum]
MFASCKSRFMALSRPPELGFSDFPAMLFELVSITAKPTCLFSSFTKGQTQLTYYYMWMISFLHHLLLAHATYHLFALCGICYDKPWPTELFSWTSVDTEKKLGPEGSPVTDPTLYHTLAGALQYLTFTRPDLSYAVQQLYLYMHDPRGPHLNAIVTCSSLSSRNY